MSDLTRSLAFAPSTLDAAARTVDVTALSGFAPVTRPAPAPDGTRTAWIEELDAAGADLSRLIGAPALKDHRNAVDSAVGVVAAARAEAGRIVASVASYSESSRRSMRRSLVWPNGSSHEPREAR